MTFNESASQGVKNIAVFLFLIGIASCVTTHQNVMTNLDSEQGYMETLYKDLPFEMPRLVEPVFKNNFIKITDFGAIGDGVKDNTLAIKNAINAIVEKGGGTVEVPRGIWLTGPIELKSNIRLHLEAGALIKFSENKNDYPLIETSFEGLETYRNQSPISGRNLINIAITGEGVIDGSGDVWRHVKKSKMSPSGWNKLVKSGGVLSDDGRIWYPSESYKKGDTAGNFNVPNLSRREQFLAIKDFLRPVMVSLVECKNVLLDGPTFQNSPAWNIHPLMCENVIIRNLNVRNPWYSQNGDGLDLESCKNAVIYNNTFDVGDDAICFKSGKNEDGRKRGMPTENVIVFNNIVYHGHGGFVVGSEMSGGVRNVKVSSCTFIGTDVGLRFKSTRGRGGVVENIFISDIDMINIPTEAIRFNLFYGGNSPILEEDQEASTEARDESMHPVTIETPSFRNIHMREIRVSDSNTAAMFQGLPEMNLQNVTLTNAVFETKNGITMIDGDGIILKNVKLNHHNQAGITLYNSKNVTLDKVDIHNKNEAEVRVLGAKSKFVNLIDCNINVDKITYSHGATKSALNRN